MINLWICELKVSELICGSGQSDNIQRERRNAYDQTILAKFEHPPYQTRFLDLYKDSLLTELQVGRGGRLNLHWQSVCFNSESSSEGKKPPTKCGPLPDCHEIGASKLDRGHEAKFMFKALKSQLQGVLPIVEMIASEHSQIGLHLFSSTRHFVNNGSQIVVSSASLPLMLNVVELFSSLLLVHTVLTVIELIVPATLRLPQTQNSTCRRRGLSLRCQARRARVNRMLVA